MNKISSVRKSITSVLNNLGKLLNLAWRTDSKLVLGYYGASGVGALFPIVASYVFKLFIDSVIKYQNISATVPVILVALLGARYITNVSWDFVMWGLKNTFFDFLFRYKIQNALNFKFLDKVSNLDIQHFEDTKTLDLISKAQDTFTWRCPDFLRQFSYLFNNFISYTSSFFLLLSYGWIAPFVITFLAIPRLYLRTKFGKLQWSIYGSGAPETRKLYYFRWLLSQKNAVTESRIFQSRDSILSKFKQIQTYLYDLNKKPVYDFLKVAFYPQVLEVVVVFGFAYLKLPQVINGSMSVGDFTFFISLLDRLANSTADMILNFGDMYENNLYVDYYFEVLALSKIIKEPDHLVKIKKFPNPPRVEFKDVSFTYPGSKNRVLKNVSFTIEPSENIAIVGPNGAGKTTIVKLLCRFYDVSGGKILINGKDLRKVSLRDWYKYLGTLFQEFMHYDFTVRENIVMGNSKINNPKLIKEAAEKSGASEFINKLPKKYNQLLGRQFEGGHELSQGQWQKLAVARAFYEGAPILIMDEPTSAIDAEAEYEIFNNLKKFYKDKTLFFISHRFSTVRNADKIIVLDKGKIIEEGTHEALMKNNKVYSRMFNKQAMGYQ